MHMHVCLRHVQCVYWCAVKCSAVGLQGSCRTYACLAAALGFGLYEPCKLHAVDFADAD